MLERRRGKVAVGALALGVSLLFTAVYHLGYSDFRGEKLRKPLAGDVIWSVPTLATLSPTRVADRPRGAARQRRRPQLRHRHVPAAASRLRGTSRPDLQAMLDELVDGSGPDRARRDRLRQRRTVDTWLGAAGLAAVTRRADADGCPHASRKRVEDLDRRPDPPARRGRNAAAVGHGRALAARACSPTATGSRSRSCWSTRAG